MPTIPYQLSGKSALVTGAGSGIGEAIARRFAAEGASVIVHDREIGTVAAAAVAASIRDSGGNAVAVAADLADPACCADLIDSAVAAYGKLDIVVNNAAFIRRSDAESTDVALWDEIMAVNVRAPFLLFKALLPHFRDRKGGVVLNIGSANAYCGEAKLLPYSVSKGALTTLTRNLADAHARDGIRVNQINLSWVLTPNEYKYKVADGLPADWPSRIPREHAPFGRLMSPEEAAHFALSLVVDAAAVVSGSVVDLGQFPIIGRNPVKEDL
jgi:NAD(P)-dependent dehydrogenase (short-subunit alcohol dehydrogenase family)